MKRLEIDLDYLATTYGLTLFNAHVYVRDDGKWMLALEGSRDDAR